MSRSPLARRQGDPSAVPVQNEDVHPLEAALKLFFLRALPRTLSVLSVALLGACANTAESKLERTTPVHMYPDGATPDGVWDLAGNVWEWTSDKYGSTSGYYICGGAWWSAASGVGASARPSSYPDLRHYDGGVRVVVVPISR